MCAREYIDREGQRHPLGGEIKRIEIATVLLRHSRLSIFDEPEAGIDLWSFNNLITVFQSLRSTLHGSMVIISHQERILQIADEIAVISGGELTHQGKAEEILPELMRGAAWPPAAARRRRLRNEQHTRGPAQGRIGLERQVHRRFQHPRKRRVRRAQSTKNIRIESKTDKPGLDIRIRPGTKGETVSIPACVTHGGVDDLVYTTFSSARART